MNKESFANSSMNMSFINKPVNNNSLIENSLFVN